jgi:hypothetical protein
MTTSSIFSFSVTIFLSICLFLTSLFLIFCIPIFICLSIQLLYVSSNFHWTYLSIVLPIFFVSLSERLSLLMPLSERLSLFSEPLSLFMPSSECVSSVCHFLIAFFFYVLSDLVSLSQRLSFYLSLSVSYLWNIPPLSDLAFALIIILAIKFLNEA